MLMAAFVGLGLALLVAFLARSMMPPPWNRYVFWALGIPSLAVVIGGIGATVYFYSNCNESVVVDHVADGGRLAMAIKMVDCGDAANRTYDVSVAVIESGKVTERTLLRSHGKPVPTDIAVTGPNTFTITLDDGTTRVSTLEGEGLTPTPVWSIINGNEVR